MGDRYLKKAFDLGELPENIDLDSPPVTGFDYLYRVRLETKKCPKVVVSNIDTTQFICQQTVKFDLCNGFIRAAPGFEPTDQWQKEQLTFFTKTRDELFTHRESLKSKFPRREFPKLSRRTEWFVYCLGKEKYEQLFGKKAEELEESGPPKSKKSRISNDRNKPLLSIILYLHQGYIIKLLSYHIEWLEKARFSHEQGEWLYALLLCLEKPLDPDTCALLRSLSRVCSSLRSSLVDPEDEALKPLNTIITIISQYFDQKDMSDNFLKDEDA